MTPKKSPHEAGSNPEPKRMKVWWRRCKFIKAAVGQRTRNFYLMDKQILSIGLAASASRCFAGRCQRSDAALSGQAGWCCRLGRSSYSRQRRCRCGRWQRCSDFFLLAASAQGDSQQGSGEQGFVHETSFQYRLQDGAISGRWRQDSERLASRQTTIYDVTL